MYCNGMEVRRSAIKKIKTTQHLAEFALSLGGNSASLAKIFLQIKNSIVYRKN